MANFMTHFNFLLRGSLNFLNSSFDFRLCSCWCSLYFCYSRGSFNFCYSLSRGSLNFRDSLSWSSLNFRNSLSWSSLHFSFNSLAFSAGSCGTIIACFHTFFNWFANISMRNFNDSIWLRYRLLVRNRILCVIKRNVILFNLLRGHSWLLISRLIRVLSRQVDVDAVLSRALPPGSLPSCRRRCRRRGKAAICCSIWTRISSFRDDPHLPLLCRFSRGTAHDHFKKAPGRQKRITIQPM